MMRSTHLLLPGLPEHLHVLLSNLALRSRGQDSAGVYHLQVNTRNTPGSNPIVNLWTESLELADDTPDHPDTFLLAGDRAGQLCSLHYRVRVGQEYTFSRAFM